MSNWPKVPLGRVANVRSGFPFSSRDWIADGIPVVKISNVKDGRLDLASCDYVAPEVARATELMLCPGDILISMTGYIGDTAWVRESDLPAVVNQRVGIFSLAEPHAIERRFLFYVLRSDEVRSEFERRGYGSAQPNISPSLIQTVAIPLPPLAEQRAIAEVLGALDDKIEANRRLVQILLSHVSETWRFHFETERADWPVRPIGEVARVVGGSTPRTTVEAFWDGDIPWATPRDLSHLSSAPLLATERRITELGLQQISSGLLPRGTVLLSSRAPIGYLAIAEVPLAVNQGFIALVPGEHLPGLYLWQWLNHHMDEIVSRANGTTFLEVSKANFRPMLISLPPSELVEGWLLAAESMYAAIVGKEVESNALVQLRDTLLPRLLSGELRLRDAESLVGQAV